MNSTNTTTTFFTANNTAPVDPKRDTVVISVEEFEDLMEYKRICQDLFGKCGGVLNE